MTPPKVQRLIGLESFVKLSERKNIQLSQNVVTESSRYISRGMEVIKLFFEEIQ